MSASDDPTAASPPPDSEGRRRGRRATIGGLLILLIAAATYGTVALSALTPSDTERSLAAFTPSATQHDPSTGIPGVVLQEIGVSEHVIEVDGLVYPTRPPSGGPHGPGRAACSGVAYPDPVSDVDAVHSLEHGAVWIAYDPVRTSARTVQALTSRVTGDPYLLLSPYPGLDTPVSLQAWGHRLALDTPEDPRFEQFIQALRANPYTPPEPEGDCGPVQAR